MGIPVFLNKLYGFMAKQDYLCLCGYCSREKTFPVFKTEPYLTEWLDEHPGEEQGRIFSGRHIGRIMKEQELVFTYTIAQYKPQEMTCNEAEAANALVREFE